MRQRDAGPKNVITPKATAAMPRSSTAHHASETTASNEFMGTSQLTALKNSCLHMSAV